MQDILKIQEIDNKRKWQLNLQVTIPHPII